MSGKVSEQSIRSLLFVPGSRPEFFAKAARSDVDAIIFDLEDAVAPQAKEEARQAVAAELSGEEANKLRLVRINHPEEGCLQRDLAVLGCHGAQAIMIPKVVSPADLQEVDHYLAAFECAKGLDPDAISVVVVVESCLGLRNLYDILAKIPRARGASLATAEQGDLMYDLGGQWTADGRALAYARGKLVCDARAAGVDWLIDGAFMQLSNDEDLTQECQLARDLGFTAKVAIHPQQIATINSTFTPTMIEIERARSLLQAMSNAEVEGLGAIRHQGMMADQANLRWAKRILALSKRE